MEQLKEPLYGAALFFATPNYLPKVLTVGSD
jgi:hypothetical protein